MCKELDRGSIIKCFYNENDPKESALKIQYSVLFLFYVVTGVLIVVTCITVCARFGRLSLIFIPLTNILIAFGGSALTLLWVFGTWAYAKNEARITGFILLGTGV